MLLRIRWFSMVIAVAVAASGLAALATPASATTVNQPGPVNYAGPGPCPAATSEADDTCVVSSGDLDVAQSGTSNTIDCRGADCRGTQSGPSATNVATCANETSADASDQRCDFTQNGATNTIEATLVATPSTPTLSDSDVEQRSEQRFVTVQNGATNVLKVNGTIAQTADSIVNIPVTHRQYTLQDSQNTMNATSSNEAAFTLDRTQTSNARGTMPTQLQDDGAGSEPDGAIAGLGRVRLIATSDGTNKIKVRGRDKKDQNAFSINGTPVKQTQGHTAGGWIVDISGTDTAIANGDGLADVDLGDPNAPVGTNEGLVKDWDQTATGLLSPPVHQEQIDDIKIPSLGRSPIKGLFSVLNNLTTGAGGHQVCNAESEGHVQVRSQGRLHCDTNAGGLVQAAEAIWDAISWKADVTCEVNQTPGSVDCPDGNVSVERHGVDIKILGEDKKNGVIPVLMLSHPDDANPVTVEDVTTIDPSTVCFGTATDPAAGACELNSRASQTDFEGDGDTDVMLHFDAKDTGLVAADSIACLIGETYDGQDVEGCAKLPKG